MSGWDNAPDYGGRGWLSTIVGAVLLLIVAFGAVMCTRAANATAQIGIEGIASVKDGDTLIIHGQEIRLHGIDAPESGTLCGRVNIYAEAASALSERIGDRAVLCVVIGQPDRYGRPVARCSVGGTDISAWLVSEGWARDWPRYSGGYYARQETEARAAQRGVWAASCPASMWRNRNYN